MVNEATTGDSDILEAIQKKISGSDSIADIIEGIFPDIQKMIPCDRLDIGLVEKDDRRVEIYHTAALYQPQYVNAGYTEDIEGESSLLKRVFQTRSYFIINNLEIHEQGYEKTELTRLLLREGILSCIVMPVFFDGDVEGILFCGSKGIDLYSERHAYLLQETAKGLSHIVGKTSQQVLLERSHQAYMEMLTFVSHELKSPTSSIITLGRTMAEGYYGKIDGKQRDALMRIVKKAEYLHAMSNKYLNLARLESNILKLYPQLVDFIDDVIEPAIELVEPQIEERALKMERNYNSMVIPVRCDPDLVKIVVLNLLSNGIRYGKKGGSLRISVDKGYKKLSISVWNEGLGFSEQDKYLLFKKFSRLHTNELVERKGSGVGLYVSWKIMHLHGGRIYAESEQGSWAKFTFDLSQYMDMCIV